jgi:PAS domain S-box-containing protein
MFLGDQQIITIRAMKSDSPLYNSRLVQVYLDYLKAHYPEVNIDELLADSGITKDEVADTAHWFTQDQTDRFHKVLSDKTGDDLIARKAGRYTASYKGLGFIKQYVTGLIDVNTAFLSMAKLIPLFSRGASVEVRKKSASQIEILARPNAGVEEKPYQCQNRLGTFEAIPKVFTNSFAEVEHPQCYHRGDPHCRYLISWTRPGSMRWRRWLNITAAIGLLLIVILFPILPVGVVGVAAILYLGMVAFLANGYSRRKIAELSTIIETHHQIAEEQIDSSNKHYSGSLLIQEIGQATAAIMNIDQLMEKLAQLMSHRLAFDRGIIMLADEADEQLVFSAGYGYSEIENKYLQNVVFDLNHPQSKGIFVRAFLDKKHMIMDDIHDEVPSMSPKSKKVAQDLGVRSILCVPIVFKQRSLGILAVDNVKSKEPLKKSDVNLLRGIASHIATSIINARSFQQLQESEDKYRQTLESIREGYFEIDLNNTIQLVNRAVSDLLGYGRDALVGSDFVGYFSQESAPRIETLLSSIISTNEPVPFAQMEMSHVDGHLLPVDLSASLIIDQEGNGVGVRGILRDATGRLELEAERQRLESQLVQAQKMEAIGTLAGGIAHNFNNWLTGILGHISLMQMDGEDNPKVLQRGQKIEQIVRNAAKMTQQLLGYAREGTYEIKPLNLNHIIQESSDTLAAAKKEISVLLDLEPMLLTVQADWSQMEQVFWNLYVNAADAMPNGGELTIRTRNHGPDELYDTEFEVAPGKKYISISISDTGHGIDTEHMEKLFDPFFTTKQVGKGTGLGLASAYGIIKSHGGHIDVQSEVDVGTTFRILLPAINAASINVETAERQVERGDETLLLVDDEAMILDANQQLLSRLGYTVLPVTSGEDAVDLYKEKYATIDLVIIDMVMPKMNGGELYAQLKTINPRVKTILSSGYSINAAAQRILDQGCNGFIQKPFDLAQLSTTIRSVLDMKD